MSGVKRDRVLTSIEIVTGHRSSARSGIVRDYDGRQRVEKSRYHGSQLY